VRWKWLVIGVALLAAVGAALGAFWPFDGRLGFFGDWSPTLRLPGVVEIQEVRLGSKIGGRVERVATFEGALVEPGQPLVYFEAPELEAQLAQAQATLEGAEAQLAKLVAMPRPEELPPSAARVRTLQANLDLAKDQYERARVMYARRAIAEEEFRQRQLTYEASRQQLAQAQADYDLLRAGAWERDKATQRAAIAQARGRVAELRADLREAVVRAPERVLVEVLSVRKGDLVPPNQPVVLVLRADDMWVKVYVPETQLGRLRLNQHVAVTVDSYPGRQFTGTVTRIASESEFTPRNVQSADERRHQVFGVKVHVPDPEGIFKSGMAAEVTVPLDGARGTK
jgi:multidrug resistance efflux pump